MSQETPFRGDHPNLAVAWGKLLQLTPHDQAAIGNELLLLAASAQGRTRWTPADWQPLRIIRLVFLVDWDPTGVLSIAGADDEYDDYVPGFYELLHNGATEDQLVDYLCLIERDTMSLSYYDAPQVVARRRAVVRKIVSRCASPIGP